jgi:phage shock protein A
MSKEDIDKLVRWRDKCEALAASLQRKVRHCDEITEERDKALRERDEALAEVKTWKHDWYVAKADLGTAMRLADVALRDVAEKYERALRERDEARVKLGAEYLRHADAFRLAREQIKHWKRRTEYAFERGAEAMREEMFAWQHAVEYVLGEDWMAADGHGPKEARAELARRAKESADEYASLKHREVMLKRAHGALTDAGCVVPIEIDKTIEHAINALAERALTAEERLERVTHERDQERTVVEQENLALRRELARIMDDH